MADRPALSRRQALILDTIRASVRDRGYPPSVREVGDTVGLASSSSVRHQLQVLEARGYLRVAHGIPRGLMIVDDPQAPTPEQAGRTMTLSHHRYGTPAYERRDTCPGCRAPKLSTTVALVDVAEVYEVCTCRDEDHTYDHLVEQLWHRACLTISGCH